MKTFGELIAWELEQDRKTQNRSSMADETGSSRLGEMMLRKLKYLNQTSTSTPQPAETY